MLNNTAKTFCKTGLKGWGLLIFAIIVGAIAWAAGYWLRWDPGCKRPFIRKKSETIWSSVPKNETAGQV
jgi:hypothetical protein